METEYQQFGSPDSTSVHVAQSTTTQTGMKRILPYVLYGIVVLLLLTLLMVTGVKFSHLHKEISEVQIHLERVGHQITNNGETIPQDVFLEKRTPVRGTCKEGWVSFKSSCYLLSTASLTWSRAEEQCQTHGAHLVVLNTVEELDFLSEISDFSLNFWIGLVERENEGHWSWVDGTDFKSTPKFWDIGQPDDWDYIVNGEDCGQLHGFAKRIRRRWNDADCKAKFNYICETRA